MSDEDLPPLDDFEEDLKTISYSHKPPSKPSPEDYTKPNTRHIEDEAKQQQEIQVIQQQVQQIEVKVESSKKKESYAGLKKGFFSSGPKEKREPITEVKANKGANPLQFKEVQEAMKMNNYLEETKKEWMTNSFLGNVEKNEKVQKLFTNPEYMRAISEFQTNPREAMIKYGNNKEVMEGLQEFCRLMGGQFQSLAQSQKK